MAQEASGALGALAEADQKPPSSLSAPEESPRPGTGTRPKKSNVTRQILTLDEYKKNIAEKAKEAGKAKSGAAGRGDETSSTVQARPDPVALRCTRRILKRVASLESASSKQTCGRPSQVLHGARSPSASGALKAGGRVDESWRCGISASP